MMTRTPIATTSSGSAPIRRAGPGDADQIAALLLMAFREFEPLYTPAGFRATTPSASEIVARLAEGPTWIALDAGVVVGTVSAIDRGEEIYVRSMAVHPAQRGRGVASQLLTIVHAYAISQGARRLTLTTTPFLTDAIRLYERTGFTRSAGPDLDLHGTPLFAMTKDLALVSGHCPTQAS